MDKSMSFIDLLEPVMWKLGNVYVNHEGPGHVVIDSNGGYWHRRNGKLEQTIRVRQYSLQEAAELAWKVNEELKK